MSGPIKAVQSVFKSVTKSPIGKIAIGAAVAYFTAGIGATVLGAVGATGMSATLTTVLSHAISGTIAGGLTSALTGDSIGKGLAFGALGGAVMGGVQSALGNYTPVGIEDMGGKAATQSAGNVGPGSQPGQPAASGASSNVQLTGTAQPGAIGNAPSITGAPELGNFPAGFDASNVAGTAVPGGTGMLQPGAIPPLPRPRPEGLGAGADASGGGILGFIKENPAAAAIAGGGVMQGLGSGLMAKGTADAATETAQMKIDAEKEKQAAISASHTGTGLLRPGPLDQTPRPKPNDRFNPASYGGKGSWVYDPTVGRIVWVAAA